MFFVLSKLLDILFAPMTWAMILVVVGSWGSWKKRARVALGAPTAALIVIATFSNEPVANQLVRSLESSAIKTAKDDATYDAVIVLGGLVDQDANETWGDRNYSDAVERLLAAFDLLRTGRARFAILSGGTGRDGAHMSEGEALADQLLAWGIDDGRLVRESESRNTHENAVECGKIIRARGWSNVVLVTSAMHMKRAAGCFRAEGLSFDTLPVDHRSHSWVSGNLLPRAERLDQSTLALREYVGRIVYRARGYSAAWP